MVGRNKGLMIYGLADPRDGRVRYIGLSSSGMNRPRQHMTASRIADGCNPHKVNWIRALKRAGLRPLIQVLEESTSRDELPDLERYWIAQGKGLGWELVNATAGGEGRSGHKASSETRAKMSAAHKAAWASGKHANRVRTRPEWSAEARAKQSASMRGNKNGVGKSHKASAEARAKMAATTRAAWASGKFARRARLSPRDRFFIWLARWGTKSRIDRSASRAKSRAKYRANNKAKLREANRAYRARRKAREAGG